MRFNTFNLIYSRGIRTGLVVKTLEISFKGRRVMLIPLYPISYNRQDGLWVRAMEDRFAPKNGDKHGSHE